MKITYEPDQIPKAVHEISFSDEPTLSEAVMGKSWDDCADPLSDIAAMVETVRQSSGMKPPDTLHCGIRMYAYLMLGRFVDNIESGIDAALAYQLPPVKFTDHLSDCFGWSKCW